MKWVITAWLALAIVIFPMVIPDIRIKALAAEGGSAAGEASAEEGATEEVSVEEMSTEEMPAEEMPTAEMSAEETSTEEASAEEMPTAEMSAEEASAEEMPTEEAPTVNPAELPAAPDGLELSGGTVIARSEVPDLTLQADYGDASFEAVKAALSYFLIDAAWQRGEERYWIQIPIAWDYAALDSTCNDRVQVLTGTLALPEGVTLAEGVSGTASIKVQVGPPEVMLVGFDEFSAGTATAVALHTSWQELEAWFSDNLAQTTIGYDRDGNSYRFPTNRWSFSGIDLAVPGLYYAEATADLGEAYRLGEGVSLPVFRCAVSVQDPTSPDINCSLPGRGEVLFPWAMTEKLESQLSEFSIWLQEDGEWEDVTAQHFLTGSHVILRLNRLAYGKSYQLQVDYPGGQTSIVSFVYEGNVEIKGVNEGRRDGSGNEIDLPDSSQPVPDSGTGQEGEESPKPEQGGEADVPSEAEGVERPASGEDTKTEADPTAGTGTEGTVPPSPANDGQEPQAGDTVPPSPANDGQELQAGDTVPPSPVNDGQGPQAGDAAQPSPAHGQELQAGDTVPPSPVNDEQKPQAGDAAQPSPAHGQELQAGGEDKPDAKEGPVSVADHGTGTEMAAASDAATAKSANTTVKAAAETSAEESAAPAVKPAMTVAAQGGTGVGQEAGPKLEGETENGIVISGLRIKALIELGEGLVVHKNGVTVSLSAEALAELQLEDYDLLSLEVACPSEGAVEIELRINGRVVTQVSELRVSVSHVSGYKEGWISVTDGLGMEIAQAALGNGVATFMTDKPGAYFLSGHEGTKLDYAEAAAITALENVMHNTSEQKGGASMAGSIKGSPRLLAAVIFPVLCISALGGFFWWRRKKVEK